MPGYRFSVSAEYVALDKTGVEYAQALYREFRKLKGVDWAQPVCSLFSREGRPGG